MNNLGMSDLIYYAKHDDFQSMKCLVELNEDINARDEYGLTALMWLSCKKEKSMEAIRYLVQCGANLNIRAKCGWTALMYASTSGYFEAVKYLVQFGADVDFQDMYGNNALILASWSGNFQISKIECIPRVNSILNVRIRHEYIEQMLTPCSKYQEIIEYLVQFGANIYIKDKFGKTAIDLTKKYGLSKATKFIERCVAAHLAEIRKLIPKLAPQISLTSCAHICSFV